MLSNIVLTWEYLFLLSSPRQPSDLYLCSKNNPNTQSFKTALIVAQKASILVECCTLNMCARVKHADVGRSLSIQFCCGYQGRNIVEQWFSNFLHQVPLQKIFGFPSTTIMTNIKMQYKWLPTAPGVCSRGVCVCVCVCVHCCVCVHFGWVKCRAQIPSMSRHFHFQ